MFFTNIPSEINYNSYDEITDEINKMFGLDIDVVYRKDFQNVEDGYMEDDIVDTVETEDEVEYE